MTSKKRLMIAKRLTLDRFCSTFAQSCEVRASRDEVASNVGFRFQISYLVVFLGVTIRTSTARDTE